MNKTSIKEANEHLQQLHQRVYELESQLQVQAMHVAELQRANADLQRRLQEQLDGGALSLAAKDRELADADTRHRESERQIQALLESARERDAAVLKLEAKARLFYEVVEHRGVLKKMVATLEELDDKKDLAEGRGGGETPPDLTASGESSSYYLSERAHQQTDVAHVDT